MLTSSSQPDGQFGPAPDAADQAALEQQHRDQLATSGLSFEDVYDRVFIAPWSGCWEWTGPRNSRDGRPRWRCTSARRVVWLLFNGPVPTGGAVTVSCGNAQCVNPDHLVTRLPDGSTVTA